MTPKLITTGRGIAWNPACRPACRALRRQVVIDFVCSNAKREAVQARDPAAPRDGRV
jgi:hypothetical protein